MPRVGWRRDLDLGIHPNCEEPGGCAEATISEAVDGFMHIRRLVLYWDNADLRSFGHHGTRPGVLLIVGETDLIPPCCWCSTQE